MAHIVPSILSADFARLGEQVAAAERGGAILLHVDVMDGHFVPNITLGQPIIASLRKATSLPLDLHLMIDEPGRYLEEFADLGADWISVHQEAVPHLHRTVHRIRDLGMRAGVALNPATPVTTLSDLIFDLDFVLIMSVNPGFGGQRFIPRALDKIRELRQMIERAGSKTEIEIDGGVGKDNIAEIVGAGAEWLVAGSSVFGASTKPGLTPPEAAEATESAVRSLSALAASFSQAKR